MQWNLIKLRREHKLSQKKLADHIGMHVDSYGAKERGDIQFRSDEMFQLKNYFGADSIEDIFLAPDFAKLEEGGKENCEM